MLRNRYALLHNQGMDWNDLPHFLAVARSGSTLAAAERLRVNQSTVARRIAALEQALGLALFARSRAGYRLTEAGEELLPAAEQVEREAETVQRLAEQRLRRLAGTVRVTASEALANTFLNPCLREFNELYPDVRIEVEIADRSLDIARGEADVALRAGVQKGEGAIVVRKLRDLEWSIYCSRDYARRSGCPQCIEDLRGHALVDGDGSAAALPGILWLKRHAGTERIVARSNSLTHLAAAVRAGLGLGALPCSIGEPDPELVRCLEPPRELDSALWLVTRADIKDEPRVRTFTDFISARTVSMRHLFELKPREILPARPSAQ
jgi:DNA-binding transcriptional LysR family regulator